MPDSTPQIQEERFDLDNRAHAIHDAQERADDLQRNVHVVLDAGFLEEVPEYNVTPEMNTVHVAMPHYRTLDDIKERNRRLGHCWFSPDTMRFFSSRVQSTIYPTADGRAYFVSSERAPGDIRKYSVRIAKPDGSIATFGDMGHYKTGRAAHATARRLAEGGE